jgi:hypothetical protein
MATTPTSGIKSTADLVKMAQAFKAQRRKAAADAGAPADPTDAGTASIPVQPDAEDPSKNGIPPGGKSNTNPTDDTNVDSKITSQTNPAESGSGHVPSTENGTAQDEAATKAAKALQSGRTLLQNLQARFTGNKSAADASTAQTPPAAPVNKGGNPDPALAEPEAVAKMASELFPQIGMMICGDVEGQAFLNTFLQKKAGEAMANDMLTKAATANAFYERQWLVEREQQAKQAAEQEAFNQAFAALSPREQEISIKLASLYQQEQANMNCPADRFWFEKGAAAFADMQSAAGGPSAEPDMSQASMPGGDGTPTPQDLLELLANEVQSGQMTPDEAEKAMSILSAVLGHDGGGAAGGDGGSLGGDTSSGADASSSGGGDESSKSASAALKALGADTLIEIPVVK